MSDRNELLNIILSNNSISYMILDTNSCITDFQLSDLLFTLSENLKGQPISNIFPCLSLEKKTAQSFPFKAQEKKLYLQCTVITTEDSNKCILIQNLTDYAMKISRLTATVDLLRSISRKILEASDVNTLSEDLVSILAGTEFIHCVAMEIEIDGTKKTYVSNSNCFTEDCVIFHPLEYKSYSYGSVFVTPLKSLTEENIQELDGIVSEMSKDTGYAIHQILQASIAEKTNKMLDAFLENIPGIAFIRDSKSRYIKMNKFFIDSYGSADWFRKYPKDIYVTHQMEELIQRDQTILEEGYVRRTRDFPDNFGNKHFFDGHYFKIQIDDDEPFIGGIGLEITDKIQAEKALSESEERYRTIYESTVTAMALLGPDGIVVSANSNVVELTGYSLNEIIGKMSWVNFVYPEDLQSVAEQRKKRLTVDSSRHQEYEFRLIRKDGSIRNIRMRTGTIPDSEGMGVISLSDITSLIDYQKQLNNSLSKTQAILEAIPDLMFVLSRDGKYIDFHSGNTNQLFFSPDEMKDKGIFDIGLPGTTVDFLLKQIHATLETGMVHNVEYSLNLPDGEHNYEAGMSPFENDTVLVLCRDVSLRKKAEAEQIKLQAQVQHVQKLESLGVLAGGIAHDFNNILMAISGNAQLAIYENQVHGDVSQYLEAIEVATSRAADLAGQMLAYSGRGEFTIVPLDLNSVVDEISDMLRVTVSKKAIMNINLQTDIPMILADSTQAGQVFMNLITNASEALDDSSGTIDVSTGVVYCDNEYVNSLDRMSKLEEGSYVFMEVKDSGSGMSDEVRKNIFNPFFTTKFTGRGLGLSAVLGIMRDHKGALEIQTELGKGSTFRALFPVVEGESSAVPELFTIKVDSSKSQGTVMFVDDEPLVRAVVETMLEQFGFSVIIAVDGNDCLEKFKENITDIDLILLDITMPGMDGDEAFAEMKKYDIDIPVIISSGYSEHEILGKFPNEYPEGFLQKPYTAEELHSKIKTILKH